MADDKTKDDAKKQTQAAAPASGGLKAMLPLILTVVLMPVLAFVMTQFVLVPKLQQAITASATTTDHGATEGEEPTGDAADAKGAGGGAKGAKTTVPLPKIIVNVKDTQATRYLMSSYTLVGQGEEFKTLLEANMEQVRDVTSGVLSTKSIRDLEKPDARNIIKAELISTINTALGKPAVKEIYITDFAIQ